MPKHQPFAERFLSALKNIEGELQGVREALDDLYSELQWGLRNGRIASASECAKGAPTERSEGGFAANTLIPPPPGQERRTRRRKKNELF
jgi:hypothetical protein